MPVKDLWLSSKGSWRICSIWEPPTPALCLGELIKAGLSVLSVQRERLETYVLPLPLPPPHLPPRQTAGPLRCLSLSEMLGGQAVVRVETISAGEDSQPVTCI